MKNIALSVRSVIIMCMSAGFRLIFFISFSPVNLVNKTAFKVVNCLKVETIYRNEPFQTTYTVLEFCDS